MCCSINICVYMYVGMHIYVYYICMYACIETRIYNYSNHLFNMHLLSTFYMPRMTLDSEETILNKNR